MRRTATAVIGIAMWLTPAIAAGQAVPSPVRLATEPVSEPRERAVVQAHDDEIAPVHGSPRPSRAWGRRSRPSATRIVGLGLMPLGGAMVLGGAVSLIIGYVIERPPAPFCGWSFSGCPAPTPPGDPTASYITGATLISVGVLALVIGAVLLAQPSRRALRTQRALPRIGVTPLDGGAMGTLSLAI